MGTWALLWSDPRGVCKHQLGVAGVYLMWTTYVPGTVVQLPRGLYNAYIYVLPPVQVRKNTTPRVVHVLHG